MRRREKEYRLQDLLGKLKSMYKAIQDISLLLRSLAIGLTTIVLAGCATLDLGSKSYNWTDFLKDTDSNSNKSVELNEFTDYLARQGGASEDVPDSFDDMDLDNNGSINESEFTTRRSITAASKVQSWRSFQSEADRNDDGTINSIEWAAAPRQQANAPKREEFNRYDINGDGEVTVAEYEIIIKQ